VSNGGDEILIVAPEKWGSSVRSVLMDAGYCATLCTLGNEAIRNAEWVAPRMVIVSYRLKDCMGVDVAEAFRGVCMVMLVIANEMDGYENYSAEHVLCVPAPTRAAELLQSVRLMLQMSSRVKKLTQERDAAERSVQDQKIIQRAKALLMNEFKITENEAHRILQKRSMDTGMTLVNVAQIILKQ